MIYTEMINSMRSEVKTDRILPLYTKSFLKNELVEQRLNELGFESRDQMAREAEDWVLFYPSPEKVLDKLARNFVIAYTYGIDEKNLELTMSKDGDWYMLSEERENEYYIADVAMVGGVNAQQNQKLSVDKKLATIEMTEKIQECLETIRDLRQNNAQDSYYTEVKDKIHTFETLTIKD